CTICLTASPQRYTAPPRRDAPCRDTVMVLFGALAKSVLHWMLDLAESTSARRDSGEGAPTTTRPLIRSVGVLRTCSSVAATLSDLKRARTADDSATQSSKALRSGIPAVSAQWRRRSEEIES